jgi:Mg2+ and Co2+ transporter CorA
MILTVFTVVSGIYGMNQVIEDLKAPIDWSKMTEYSPFEYLALFLTFTGIAVSIFMTLKELWNTIRRRRRKRYYSRE